MRLWTIGSIALALIARPASAVAQDRPSNNISLAKQLIEAGQFDQAETILNGPLNAAPPVEVEFLLGMIAIGRKQPRAAVARFRQALVYQPSTIRLRLELARALYLARDYENAFRQFQRARAGNPPAPVVASIDRYLLAIRLDKNWSYNVRIALAPDTNLNNATSASSTDILGLPFDLDQTARRKSGMGAALEAGIGFAPKITKRSRLRLGAQIQRREYGGRHFDDMTLTAHAGPRLILKKWDLSLLATAHRRWYGGTDYSEGRGARMEAVHYPDGKTQLAGTLFAQKVEHQTNTSENGMVIGASSTVVRALSPSSAAVVKISSARQTARTETFANWSGSAGLGYFQDLRGGFSIYVEPSVIVARYDGVDPLFGQRRTDKMGQLTLSILNRRIVASRFTPQISFSRTHRLSNIDLYDFKKTRVEIGLSSEF